MSMWAGQTAGLKYNNELEMRRQALDEGYGLGRRGRGRYYPVPMTGAGIQPQSQPQEQATQEQAGVRPGARQQDPTPETEKLPDFIKLAMMGNPRGAEQIFNQSGMLRVRPGSTVYDDKTGSLNFVDDASGKPVSIRRDYIDRMMGLKPLTEKDQAQIEKTRAETEKIKTGKPGLTEYQGAQLKQTQERDRRALIGDFEDTQAALAVTLRQAQDAIGKDEKTYQEANLRAGLLKQKLDRLYKDLAAFDNTGTPAQQGQQPQAGIPVQPPPQALPKKGKGTMTMNGITVDVPQTRGGYGGMWTNDRAVTTDDVRQPAGVTPSFGTEQEALGANLPVGTQIMVNGRPAIVE